METSSTIITRDFPSVLDMSYVLTEAGHAEQCNVAAIDRKPPMIALRSSKRNVVPIRAPLQQNAF